MNSYLDELAAMIRAELPEEASPPPDSDRLFLLYAVLLRVKGEQVTPSDVHDAWSAWMLESNADHAAIVAFDQLDERIQREDLPYVAAIRRAARRLRGES